MAVAFDSVFTATAGSASTTTVSNVVVPTGNPGLVAVISIKSTSTVTSVVYNGSENFVQQITDVNGNARVVILTLEAPTVTTADVVVTLSGNSRHVSTIGVYTGVDQDTLVRTAESVSANGTDAAPTVDVTTDADDMVVSGLCQVSAGPDSATADHNSRSTVAATGGGTDTRSGLQDVISTGGTDTMGWTMGGSDNWATAAIALIPAFNGPSGSGTLVASDSEIVGSGELVRTGTGVLAASDSAIVGSGEVVHVGSGVLKASNSVIVGTGDLISGITGSGILKTSESQITGSGLLIHSGTGVLASTASQIVGSGLLKRIGSGVLVASSSQIVGAGSLLRGGTGILVASPSVVAGVGQLVRIGSGVLKTSESQIVGIGTRIITGSGVLKSSDSVIVGSGVLVQALKTGSGVLKASDSKVVGVGTVRVPKLIVGTGTLRAGPSRIVGEGHRTKDAFTAIRGRIYDVRIQFTATGHFRLTKLIFPIED